MFNLQTQCIWITHDIRWIKLDTTTESEKKPLGVPEATKKAADGLLTIETVLDEDDSG